MRWLAWAVPEWDDELPARLPESEDERHGVRVWAALAELARSDGLDAGSLRSPGSTSKLLFGGLDAGLVVEDPLVVEPPPRDEAACRDHGVRTALAMPEPALTLDQARAVLAGHG